jgi:hypothetical protein
MPFKFMRAGILPWLENGFRRYCGGLFHPAGTHTTCEFIKNDVSLIIK